MRNACRKGCSTRTLELHCSGRCLSVECGPIGGYGLMGDRWISFTLGSCVSRAWYAYINTFRTRQSYEFQGIKHPLDFHQSTIPLRSGSKRQKGLAPNSVPQEQ